MHKVIAMLRTKLQQFHSSLDTTKFSREHIWLCRRIHSFNIENLATDPLEFAPEGESPSLEDC